jgi:hypothetical protein
MFVDEAVAATATGMETLEATATAPVTTVANAAWSIVNGLLAIPQAAADAGTALTDLPPPNGTPPKPPPGQPAATGDIVLPRPGGTLYNVGEGGQAEVIAPVKALLQQVGAGLARQMDSGGGGGGRSEIHIYLDGKQLSAAIEERAWNGGFRVPATAIVDRPR